MAITFIKGPKMLYIFTVLLFISEALADLGNELLTFPIMKSSLCLSDVSPPPPPTAGRF